MFIMQQGTRRADCSEIASFYLPLFKFYLFIFFNSKFINYEIVINDGLGIGLIFTNSS